MPVGIEFRSTEDMVTERIQSANKVSLETQKEAYDNLFTSSLASHINAAFIENRNARENSGVNRLMLDSLRAYNGEYSSEELAKINDEGGSRVFMNLTATKCRAAISWIKDILLASKEDSFRIKTTTVPELPEDIEEQIEEKLTAEFEAIAQKTEGDIAATLKESQEKKRDLYEAIREEIQKEANFAFEIIEKDIKDSLEEGNWRLALSDFIDDFCIMPAAVLKGPIINKETKLKWEDGKPIETKEYVFSNKRISPLDVYPAPEAEGPNDGNFIEHLRYSRKELSDLIGHPAYKTSALLKVLEENQGKGYPVQRDGNIEDEKAEQEQRDDSHSANVNVFHGLHFWGTAPAKTLRDWGIPEEKLGERLDEEEVDIEAIMVGSTIIKCRINSSGFRPYHVSSFQKRPGSFWGNSLPYQMRDIQRICNACARALSNNMGLSSGPIMELYMDRLADGQEVSQLRPRDIVQVTSDPTGGSGRAIQFFTIPSVANELLAVYERFELKADDVTMIPRYAYGNQNTGGAAQTASGLSMLLESASKGIKDAIRHIDEDVIIPRVRQEFYFKMAEKGEDYKFSGDIEVVALGSSALTMKGAEQMRRNEFLQITANPIDQKIIGPQGRAEILRVLAKDLGLGENIVPGRQEIKKAQLQEMEAAQSQVAAPVQAAQIQNETNMAIAQERNKLTAAEIQRKTQKDLQDAKLKVAQLEQKMKEAVLDAQGREKEIESDEHKANQAIALSVKTGDKSNRL